MKLVVLFLMLHLTSHAQTAMGLEARAGIGTFAMGTQREFQNDIKESGSVPISPEVVHSFDPYWTWGLGYHVNVSPKLRIGVWYERASTGGRLSYLDFSGSYTLDQVLSCWQAGFFFQKQINQSSHWPLFATFQIGIVESLEKVSSKLVVGTVTQVEAVTLEATNLSFRPGLMLAHKIGPFELQAAVGYELHTVGTLTNSDNLVLNTQDGEEISVDWSGVRFQVGVMVPIHFGGKASSSAKP